jgi:hypothetical protein
MRLSVLNFYNPDSTAILLADMAAYAGKLVIMSSVNNGEFAAAFDGKRRGFMV